jgi:hypothetical protein
MGSLNQNGGIIQHANETHRNIGGSITRTSGELPNNEGALVKEYAGFPAGDNNADIVKTQYATHQVDDRIKTTHSVDDSTVSLSARPLPVTASGNPEITLQDRTQEANRFTGDKIVLGSSDGDVVISRTDNTSFRPTS